ncbi:glycosyl hydrolase family 8 [Enterococcus pseudoavium]|uniref:Glucanase n=1 Tax=Enterococcus pseudoavium TaxID=44007 RepID=A0AAE4HZN7_9ENTE|nr:glycosyl hydrolase family 8 [Enterococcus pseudoavium]MDT2736431.1 glycosyl hydrolase family 8 [Enterococcus pseudoavium]MDT2755454.1 glycosyl hydrolase family 8 [Enterococcus pseudoavium]
MRRRPIITWLLLALLFLVYIAGVLFNIRDNQIKLEKTTYQKWRTAYVTQSDEGSFIKTNNQANINLSLSEGHGYGMLITMEAAKRGWATESDFDDLYRYYQNFQISAKNPLMSWRQTFNEDQKVEKETTNATDGDLDIAYALIEASEQWPNSQTDYKTAAKHLLAAIKTHNYNSNNQLLTVGDWATPDSNFYNLIRPSDIVPSYFDKFATFSDDHFWLTLKENSLKALATLSKQHKSGLIPDFAWAKDGTVLSAKKNDIAGANDGNYGANACRIPWRLASSNDQESNQILSKMMNFFLAEDTITEGYTLSGKALSQSQSKSFSAPILYAATKKEAYENLVDSQSWVLQKSLSGSDYYGETLTTLITLQMNQK